MITTMSKSSEKNLVGQPIFNQILKIIPREVINRVVMEAKSDRYYKSFSTWDELVSLLFGVFTRCDSAREVCDGMASLGGKLNYLDMDFSPAKSTFNDGLNNRSEKVFEQIYFALIRYYSDFLSDSSVSLSLYAMTVLIVPSRNSSVVSIGTTHSSSR